VGRSDLISAACVIAALLAHRRRAWVAVVWYAAALSAKESGITFLALAVASDLLLADPAPADGTEIPAGRSASPAVVPGPAHAMRWPLYAGYAVVTALYAGVLDRLFRGVPLVRVAEPWQHASNAERWLTAARIIPEYARLLLFPLRLHVDYMPRVIDVVRAPTAGVTLGIAIVVVAAALVVRTWRRAPVVAFAILLLACTIAPVANLVFPSGLMLAERTLYLPSVALAILVAWAWDRWSGVGARLVETGGAIPREAIAAWRPRLGVAIVSLAVCALAARGWVRTPVWRDDRSVLAASLSGEPESYRVHERAADAAYQSGDVAGAIHEYAVARALYPMAPLLYQAPAALMAMRGEERDAGRLLDSAQRIDPSRYADAMRRAWVRYAARDYRGSIAWARAAYLMERDSVDAIMVLTQAAQQIDDVTDATTAFRLGLADHPRNRALHRSYAAMLASTGDSTASRREAALGGGS